MPELPEVETLRRELESAIKGKTIKSAEVNWPKTVKPLGIKEFQAKIKNKKIIEIGRRAKVLILDLDGPLTLLIHLKMTGQLIYQPSSRTKKNIISGGHPQKGGLERLPNKFTHAILKFTDGSVLYFNDLRKFGWMRLVDDRGVEAHIKPLGIEPLSPDFSAKYLRSIIKKYPNRNIKLILMDQKLIAGIGNIYADESCFCARILPTRKASSLKAFEIKKLRGCILKILKFAISKKGTSADTYVQLSGKPGGFVPYLRVYGREKEKCKRCGGMIKKMKLNQRGTHFCPGCQK